MENLLSRLLRLRPGLAAFCLLSLAAFSPPPRADDLPLHRLALPPGFAVSVYARIPGARSLALGEQGTLFVGTRNDTVYAARDRDGDGKAETVSVLAQGLNTPNGVAFRDGALYVAEVSRILRYDRIEERIDSPPAPAVVRGDLPTERHHGWKYLAFGPDGLLYAPVGAPCNVCDRPDDERFASILRMNPDGSNLEIMARGVRNSVGFAWHPQTRELWFTSNGRDWMGDDAPPDTLNHAPRPGLHFGFPYCHGGDIPDPEFGKLRSCAEFAPPALRLPAHVAALGMKFYTGSQFPPEYRNRIFIAEHGSWNRSSPVGYRVGMATLEGDRVTDYRPFLDGFLHGESAWGRPVDVLETPDGALLVSDDRAGAVYRVAYRP
jgi:glucose/arabinose dehydrogenase